jgi:iron(III) transport system ATP-binding protein
MTATLDIRGLAKSFNDHTVLDHIDLQVSPGSISAVVGSSGCGKTTLLRLVAGFETPDEGTIAISGRAVASPERAVAPHKRSVGYVAQDGALFPHLTVGQNIAYGLTGSARSRGIRDRVAELLETVSLDASYASRRPHQLSGGQQQRVAIARALVYNPPVVLMDEPLSNLDAKLREEARAWLRELIVRLNLSALVVTHDQTEAMAMADRILLLNAGRIEQQGTPEELYSRPQTQFTAEFMGSNNHLPGRVAQLVDGRAMLEGESWRLWGMARGNLKPGDPATGIIRLERTQIANGAAENRIRTELVTGMFLGDRRENLFKLGSLRLRCYGATPSTGECWLELPRDALWVFPGA